MAFMEKEEKKMCKGKMMMTDEKSFAQGKKSLNCSEFKSVCMY